MNGPNADGADQQQEVILSLRGIHKSFVREGRGSKDSAARLHVLKGVSLDLHRREVLVLIGRSGSGKSTLLRCMNLLEPFDEGSMRFLDETWEPPAASKGGIMDGLRRKERMRMLRARIGMVFQQFNLFPHKTVVSNVMTGLVRVKKMGSREARDRALEELARVGLEDKAESYPNQLSGGQKQRVAIARALAMQPQIMLFDEPTSALDPELREGVLNEMKKLATQGMTMVVVTHEMAFAREVGDRVMFMDDGTIVETGPARSFINNPQDDRTRLFLRSILAA